MILQNICKEVVGNVLNNIPPSYIFDCIKIIRLLLDALSIDVLSKIEISLPVVGTQWVIPSNAGLKLMIFHCHFYSIYNKNKIQNYPPLSTHLS